MRRIPDDWWPGIFVALLVGLVGFLLALAGEAHAADQMTNVAAVPASLTLLNYALTPAVAYWHSEGQQLSCEPQLYLYDERGRDRHEVDARAELGGCKTYWNRLTLRETLREAYDPWRGLAAQGLRDICQTTAHELGHNLGLEHTEYGLMDPTGGAWEWVFPDGTRAGGYVAECKLWARAILSARRVRVARCETKRCVTRITQKRLDMALAGL